MLASICSILSFVITMLAFLYGLYSLKNGGPMFIMLLIFAVGCQTLKEIWGITNTFFLGMGQPNLSLFGTVGCLFFLCSANYGHLDSIVDERDGSNRLAKIGGMCAAIIVLCMISIFVVVNYDAKGIGALIIGISFIPALPASYFSAKHLLLKEDAFGFLKMTKLCNVFILMFICFSWINLLVDENVILGPVSAVLVAITMACLTYSCKRGLKLWKTLI